MLPKVTHIAGGCGEQVDEALRRMRKTVQIDLSVMTTVREDRHCNRECLLSPALNLVSHQVEIRRGNRAIYDVIRAVKAMWSDDH